MLAVSFPWHPPTSFSPISWQPRDLQEDELPSSSLNPPVIKSQIPSEPGTQLPLDLNPFYTSDSLASYPRDLPPLDPLTLISRAPDTARTQLSSIFYPDLLPRSRPSQLLLPLHWLLKAFALRPSSRWDQRRNPNKTRIRHYIQSLSDPNSRQLSTIRFCRFPKK